jgi:hypothetical protein
MKLTLTNRSGRCLVFALPHASYCAKASRCGCRAVVGRETKPIAGSLTLAAGLTSPPLDRAVLVVPEIDRAIGRGELEVAMGTARGGAPLAAPQDVPRTSKKRGL